MEPNTRTGNTFGLPPCPLQRRPNRDPLGFCLGFTFIELVMVITLLSILIAIAVPVYQAQVLASKESVLKHNLAIIRERLDQFKADRGKYPTDLQELVDKDYLREIPVDPMTDTNEWEVIYEEYDPEEPEEELGIYDVRSLSTDTSSHGDPYGEW